MIQVTRILSLFGLAAVAALVAVSGTSRPPGGGAPSASAARPGPPDSPRAERVAGPRVFATPSSPEEMRTFLALLESTTAEDAPSLHATVRSSESPLVVANALRSLERLDVRLEPDELTALLHDDRARVRQEAIRSIGRGGHAHLVAQLESVLAGKGGNDETERALAIQALGRIGDARSVSLLTEIAAAEGSTRTERVFARQALDGAFTVRPGDPAEGWVRNRRPVRTPQRLDVPAGHSSSTRTTAGGPSSGSARPR